MLEVNICVTFNNSIYNNFLFGKNQSQHFAKPFLRAIYAEFVHEFEYFDRLLLILMTFGLEHHAQNYHSLRQSFHEIEIVLVRRLDEISFCFIFFQFFILKFEFLIILIGVKSSLDPLFIKSILEFLLNFLKFLLSNVNLFLNTKAIFLCFIKFFLDLFFPQESISSFPIDVEYYTKDKQNVFK